MAPLPKAWAAGCFYHLFFRLSTLHIPYLGLSVGFVLAQGARPASPAVSHTALAGHENQLHLEE